MEKVVSLVGPSLSLKHELFDFIRGKKKSYLRYPESTISKSQDVKGFSGIDMSLVSGTLGSKSSQFVLVRGSTLLEKDCAMYSKLLKESANLVLVCFDCEKMIDGEDIINFIEQQALTDQRKGIILLNPINSGLFEAEEDVEELKALLNQKFNNIVFTRLVEMRDVEISEWNGMCKAENKVIGSQGSLIRDILSA